MTDMKQDEIKRPAVKIQQGNKTLLATFFRVEDFQNPDFYRIDRLDPENKTKTGFQRILQEERANRVANYVVEAWKKDRQAFLPTSVFLATEKDIAFDEQRNEIHFNRMDVCPFDVVDGQHRIMGLLRAAEKIPELGQFPIAANIAIMASRPEQMLHFYVVNMTQKAVDPAVAQRIRGRFTDMLETENLPYIPSWIRNQIEAGTDQDALSVVDFLHSAADSPWNNRIEMGNKKLPGHFIKQKSFVNALKKSIIKDSHPLVFVGDKDKRNRIFKNYWIAIEHIFTEPKTHDDSVVFKAIGAMFFCRASSVIINVAQSTQSYKVEDFVNIFQSVREHLPPEALSIMDPNWWVSGGPASGMNSGSAEKKAVEFARAVNAANRQEVAGDSL